MHALRDFARPGIDFIARTAPDNRAIRMALRATSSAVRRCRRTALLSSR
jgi:hypothetical protein